MAAPDEPEATRSGDFSPRRRPVPAVVQAAGGILALLLAAGIAGFVAPHLLTAGGFAVWAAVLLLLLLFTTALLPLPAAYLLHRYAPGLPRELSWIVSLLSGTLLLTGLLQLISTPLSGIEGSTAVMSDGHAVHMERQPMYYLLLVPAMIGSLAVFYYVTDREP